MKLNEITKTGFYTTDLNKREVIFEVLKNTDETWLTEYPDELFVIDTWNYAGTDDFDVKHYNTEGSMMSVKYCDPIEVFKINDIKYEYLGCGRTHMIEKSYTYKDELFIIKTKNKKALLKLKAMLSIIKKEVKK